MKMAALGLAAAMAAALTPAASAQKLELRIGTVSGQLAIADAVPFKPFTDYLTDQGGIILTSERGRGTAVSIYLPTTTREAKVERAAAPVRRHVAPSGPRTVLVVEDQDDVRGFTRDVLSSAGYTVLEAASGDDALRIVDANRIPIDLLLTDVVLVGTNGRELAEQFRQRHPDALVAGMIDESGRSGVSAAG